VQILRGQHPYSGLQGLEVAEIIYDRTRKNRTEKDLRQLRQAPEDTYSSNKTGEEDCPVTLYDSDYQVILKIYPA